ncbi:hypothetical protein M0813_08815 [Anaeramoeba flamelloides]|uniref:Uncharacterized protein n=1 Tax=Anaeramoeba flamelloides TaxID=1746091 RepID=A0ABQ8XB36_9EUKA|nr:hypothetical protein M0813_08815 [Anaeramoeba flamelloides]
MSKVFSRTFSTPCEIPSLTKKKQVFVRAKRAKSDLTLDRSSNCIEIPEPIKLRKIRPPLTNWNYENFTHEMDNIISFNRKSHTLSPFFQEDKKKKKNKNNKKKIKKIEENFNEKGLQNENEEKQESINTIETKLQNSFFFIDTQVYNNETPNYYNSDFEDEISTDQEENSNTEPENSTNKNPFLMNLPFSPPDRTKCPLILDANFLKIGKKIKQQN